MPAKDDNPAQANAHAIDMLRRPLWGPTDWWVCGLSTEPVTTAGHLPVAASRARPALTVHATDRAVLDRRRRPSHQRRGNSSRPSPGLTDASNRFLHRNSPGSRNSVAHERRAEGTGCPDGLRKKKEGSEGVAKRLPRSFAGATGQASVRFGTTDPEYRTLCLTYTTMSPFLEPLRRVRPVEQQERFRWDHYSERPPTAFLRHMQAQAPLHWPLEARRRQPRALASPRSAPAWLLPIATVRPGPP